MLTRSRLVRSPNDSAAASQLNLAEKLYDFGSKNDLKGMFLAITLGANPAGLLESGMTVFHQLISDGYDCLSSKLVC